MRMPENVGYRSRRAVVLPQIQSGVHGVAGVYLTAVSLRDICGVSDERLRSATEMFALIRTRASGAPEIRRRP